MKIQLAKFCWVIQMFPMCHLVLCLSIPHFKIFNLSLWSMIIYSSCSLRCCFLALTICIKSKPSFLIGVGSWTFFQLYSLTFIYCHWRCTFLSALLNALDKLMFVVGGFILHYMCINVHIHSCTAFVILVHLNLHSVMSAFMFALLEQLFSDILRKAGNWKWDEQQQQFYFVVMCILQHRLRNCGLSNAIYLVEEYGSMEHFKIPEETLNQAIINTQVLIVVV